MFKLIIVILTLCLTIIGCKITFKKPLPLDNIIMPEMDMLNSLGVDTILIYTEIEMGCIAPLDCEKPNQHQAYYFFWLKNGKNYFTLRDNCYEYNILPIDTGPFMHLYQIKDSFVKDTFQFTHYFQPHYSADKLTLLDDYNDFEVIYSGVFVGEPKAVYYNKSTLKAKFRNSLKSQIDTLCSELILTRKRKNYR